MIDTLRRLAHRTAAFVRRDPLDRELDSELASHLAMAEDEHVRRGASPEEARRLARLELGGYDAAVERHRDARGLPTLDALVQDLRYAIRSLRREPGFAAIAIAILALGIGANTAVFSIVNALVLRPLPFRDADRLVWITQASETEGLSAQTYPVAAYQAFRHENQSLEDLTAYFAFFGYMDFALASGNQAEHVSGVYLVPRFFELLGVSPARGRLFVPEEERPNGRAAAIISDALWHRRFGGDPAVVGRTVTLNNAPITIVGVLPEDFDFASVFSPGARVDLFMPAPLDTMKDWGNTLALVGRLKPGITTEAAASEFAVLGPRIEKLQPALQGRTHAQVSALKAHVSGSMRPMLVVLWAAVAFVLLIVCANLASLLIARTAARTREIAVRMALGAGRGRLLRQMVAEGVLLSLAGAAAGIPLAFALTAYVKSAVVTSIPLLAQVRVDGVALIATATIAIVTGVVIGAIPGIRVSAGSMSAALKEQGRGTTDSRWHHRLRSGLVVGEIALASMLLVGAGLLMRSFVALMSENFGFRPERVVEVRVDLPQGISDDQRSAFAEEIARRAAAVPGVAQAAITDALPLDRNRQWGLGRVGSQRKDDGVSVFLYVIGPGYFGTMGIPLTAGRDFSAADRAKTLPVAIISKSAARALWPGQDPIGRHVTTGAEVEVIGVVDDVRQTSLEDGRSAQCYLPYTQVGPAGLGLVVRTHSSPESVVPAVRAALMPLVPTIGTTEFRPIVQLVERASSPRRFLLSLVGGFSLTALALACLGIYGVVSYNVAQRRQEIGVRMALGATSRGISLEVLGGTLRLAAVGVVLGTVGAAIVARLISSLLFGTSPVDPLTFLGTAAALVLVALGAGALPALAAARVEPMSALRNE
jgi:predicted permease